MSKANLTYYLFEGLLVGTLNGRGVMMSSVRSGGAAGSKTKGRTQASVVNNPYRTGQKAGDHHRIIGGPIPLGAYSIGPPTGSGYARRARLTPSMGEAAFTKATGRGGFLIHFTGPIGSDGCLVPTDASEFTRLMDGLAADGGGILHVLESTNDGRFA